jgi:hypothetical protein
MVWDWACAVIEKLPLVNYKQCLTVGDTLWGFQEAAPLKYDKPLKQYSEYKIDRKNLTL